MGDAGTGKQADLSPWTSADLREFAEHYEVTPKNDRELFSIAMNRLIHMCHLVNFKYPGLTPVLQGHEDLLAFCREPVFLEAAVGLVGEGVLQ